MLPTAQSLLLELKLAWRSALSRRALAAQLGGMGFRVGLRAGLFVSLDQGQEVGALLESESTRGWRTFHLPRCDSCELPSEVSRLFGMLGHCLSPACNDNGNAILLSRYKFKTSKARFQLKSENGPQDISIVEVT